MPGDPHPLSHSFAAEILHTQADALVSLGRSLATAQSAAFDHAALLLDHARASVGTSYEARNRAVAQRWAALPMLSPMPVTEDRDAENLALLG